MKILLCFLFFALALVQGREYCPAGVLCSADWQCKQELGIGFSYLTGYCCSGRCTTTTNYVSRGSFCNTSDPCVGQCPTGDSCINNACVGALVTPGCSCTLSTECKTPSVDGVTISTSCVNGTCTMELPRDAACSTDGQCASGSCYQSKCLGESLSFGDSCRLSQECSNGYQCLNGKCGYTTEGMACSGGANGCDRSKYFCNTTSSKCQSLVATGGYCNGGGQCVSSAFCNTTTGFTYSGPCIPRAGEGAACDSATMPCASGLSCVNFNYGVKKCVKYYSVPNHGYCTSTIQCAGEATCGREGANNTAYFCVPDHSVQPGGNCSYDDACPDTAQCSSSTSPSTCTTKFLGKDCQSNSSSTDSSQCYELDCACNNKCEVSDQTSPYCGSYDVAPGDPTKMNDADRKMTANAACCSICFGGRPNSYRTSLTGFQINCKTLSITMMPACNTTSGGAPLVLNCDDWSGVSLGSTTNLSVLFVLITSLFAYFQ